MSLDVQPQPSRLGDLSAFSITRTSTPSLDERHRLPSIGFDISRPPSTSSQSSNYFPPRRPSPNPGVQLPALRNISALATLANSSSPDSPLSRNHGYVASFILQYQEMIEGINPVVWNCSAVAEAFLPAVSGAKASDLSPNFTTRLHLLSSITNV
jgi:hypothetical protein